MDAKKKTKKQRCYHNTVDKIIKGEIAFMPWTCYSACFIGSQLVAGGYICS